MTRVWNMALACALVLGCSSSKKERADERPTPVTRVDLGESDERVSDARAPGAGDGAVENQPGDARAGGDDMPPRMRCLVESYPEHLCGGDATHVFWCDGTKMLWDDGVDKPDHQTLLETADLEDMLAQPYPRGARYPQPLPVNFEPGRVRNQAFFLKMYGHDESAMRRTLTRIQWLPSTVDRRIRVTSVNRVHEKLALVSQEIEGLSRELQASVAESSGPFYWRDIKGTTRKSMHSFAIAFDVGLDHAQYWRWSKVGADGRYDFKNDMPMEIVEIFEKHGFVWGGKWYHFDTPHFEYRPELLHPACVAAPGNDPA